jgi:general secretion pathway protein H
MARIRMSQAGCSGRRARCDAGFTLFELLAVMVVLGMAIVAVSTFSRSPSAGLQVKAAAQLAASRLRDLRASALTTGSERSASIDVDRRIIRFSDGRAPLQLARSIAVAVTGAESERRAKGLAGVRFFPNGSSTGATIQFRSERQAYEVRINWLTGRVSTGALN